MHPAMPVARSASPNENGHPEGWPFSYLAIRRPQPAFSSFLTQSSIMRFSWRRLSLSRPELRCR